MEQRQLNILTALLLGEQVGRGPPKAGLIIANVTFVDATGTKETFTLAMQNFPFCTKHFLDPILLLFSWRLIMGRQPGSLC